MLVIEFDLPTGAGGMAASMARGLVLQRMSRFRKEHNVQYHYNTFGYTLRVWFDNESDYTFFALAYDKKDDWREYRVVEVDNPDERKFR